MIITVPNYSESKSDFPALLTILLTLVFFNRCSDESLDQLTSEPILEAKAATAKHNINSYQDSKINNSRRDIAARLSSSLKDKEFRKFLKKEAMKQVDGDYDVYFRDLSSKSIPGKGRAIDHIYPQSNSRSERDKTEEIEALDRGLIISIPVHAEEWDEENFTPPVVFLPEFFNESTAKTVTGYDADGNEITLSAQVEPDFPVIVVRPSDRIDAEGNMIFGPGANASNHSNSRIAINHASSTIASTSSEEPIPCTASPVTSAPASLTINRYGVQNEVRVSWPAVPNADFYRVYMQEKGSHNWTLAAHTAYTAKFITVSGNAEYYTFKVRGGNCATADADYLYVSEKTTSCIPNTIPYNVRTLVSGSGTVAVDWSQSSSSETEGYKLLYRKDYLVDDGKGNYTTQEGNVWNIKTTNSAVNTDYLLTGLSPGFYMTKVRAYNSCGTTYDSEWSGNFASTRVPGRAEKITRFKFTDVKHWESWVLGKLEWKVWVVMGNATNAGTVTEALYKNIKRKREGEWININLPVLSSWYPTVDPGSREESTMYTVMWAELDHVCQCVTNFSVAINAKYTQTVTLTQGQAELKQSVEAGTNISFDVDINKVEGDKTLPAAYVNYWDTYGTASDLPATCQVFFSGK